MGTDTDWEQLAQLDPYWAVVTHDEYRIANFNEKNSRKFFGSGEQHIEDVFQILKRHFDAPDRFDTSLDFGCGVGRLVLPLARRSNRVFGVDVSPTMLATCRDNIVKVGLQNVALIQSDDKLSGITSQVDLVTSYIVFQHIPPKRGYELLASLLDKLKTGGFGYIHLTFANLISKIDSEEEPTTGSAFRYYQRIGDDIFRLRGTPAPALGGMQMNHYNLNEVMCLLLDYGILKCYLRQTNHDGCIGAEIFFQKT